MRNVSFLGFAYFAFFQVYFSENTICIAVSETFETAHFDKKGHFWKVLDEGAS